MGKLRFIALAAATLAARTAAASDPDLFGDLIAPPTPRGDADDGGERPAEGDDPIGLTTRALAAPRLLYLNFSDGTDAITFAPNDRAGENASAILAADPYPAFKWEAFISQGATREDVVRSIARRVHQAFLPYNVIVTTVRPGDPIYTMVMIGGSPAPFGLPADVAGIALMDCVNRQESNIVYAFPANIRGDAHILFVTIAQEAAHSYGLEHTDDASDIMFPRANPAQESFVDAESAVVGPSCGPISQNSHARLQQMLGAWPGGDKPLLDGSRDDAEPPTIRFDDPASGAQVGATFVVRAFADDDVRVDHVVLEAGSERRTLTEPPWQWTLSHFPAGPLALSATAVDGAGRTATAAITVTVSPGGDAGGGCAIGRSTGTSPLPLAPPVVLAAALAAVACAGRRRRL